MTRVLIFGATGYIGRALALSLLRQGQHAVYGLARTPSKARLLARDEITPVLGSITDSASYLSLIESEGIEVVVDASGAGPESATLLRNLVRVGKLGLETEDGIPRGGNRLGFVYVSGTWIHGSSHEKVNDLEAVGTKWAKAKPPKLVEWRVGMEREVLSKGTREVLNVMVVRPAMVYGRESHILGIVFRPILDAMKSNGSGTGSSTSTTANGSATVKIPIKEDSVCGWVHVDDVAEGLRLAVEKVGVLAGTGEWPVFDLMGSREKLRNVVEESAKVFGFGGKVELVGAGEENLFAQAVQTSFNGTSGRAKTLLGWRPNKARLVDGMDVYAKAFVAGLEDS
ncbi:hypothetical protein MMC09_000939 [Bachmanniomyces sp. S44760]|nr:hypothetical protein [Bachmanniomyces sp. S44760]